MCPAGLRAGAYVVQSRSLTVFSLECGAPERSAQSARPRRLQNDARADSRAAKAGAGVEAEMIREANVRRYSILPKLLT